MNSGEKAENHLSGRNFITAGIFATSCGINLHGN
jgi:hypothetical protein